MAIRDFFNKQSVEVSPEELDLHLEGPEQSQIKKNTITREQAIGLPSVYANVELISNVISNLEVKLYKESEGSVEEIKDDKRVALLNDAPNDLMSGDELKKSMVRDYLLDGACYVYMCGLGYSKDKWSLYYIPTVDISLLYSADIIFKTVTLCVQGQNFSPENFIICTKNTIDGAKGKGIVSECNSILKQALDNMNYTTQTMGNGGVKRGVLQSTRRLTAEAIGELKKAWKRLYEQNNDCIVLNEGITYHELQQTGEAMQMIESKNAIDADICRHF